MMMLMKRKCGLVVARQLFDKYNFPLVFISRIYEFEMWMIGMM